MSSDSSSSRSGDTAARVSTRRSLRASGSGVVEMPPLQRDFNPMVLQSDGSWVLGKIIDVKENEHPMFNRADRKAMRKTFVARRSSRTHSDMRDPDRRDIPPNAWLLILSEGGEEWMHYVLGGPICVKERFVSCSCARHSTTGQGTDGKRSRTGSMELDGLSRKKRATFGTAAEEEAEAELGATESRKKIRQGKPGLTSPSSPAQGGNTRQQSRAEDSGNNGIVNQDKDLPKAPPSYVGTTGQGAVLHASGQNTDNDDKMNVKSEGESAGLGSGTSNNVKLEVTENEREHRRVRRSSVSDASALVPLAPTEPSHRVNKEVPLPKEPQNQTANGLAKGSGSAPAAGAPSTGPQPVALSYPDKGITSDGIDMSQFYPEKVQSLRDSLGIATSQLFREANLTGGVTNSAYCWLRREHMHRPAILEAGRLLARWYTTALPRAPEDFKPAPEPTVKTSSEPKRSKVKAKEKAKDKAKTPDPKGSTPSATAAPTLRTETVVAKVVRPSFNEGVSKNDKGKWEVYVALTQDIAPSLVAVFDTSEAAEAALSRSKSYVATHLLEMKAKKRTQEVEVKRRRQRNAYCRICDRKEKEEPVHCNFCPRRYHPHCIDDELDSKGFQRIRTGNDLTCLHCIKSMSNSLRTHLGLPTFYEPQPDPLSEFSRSSRRSDRKRQSTSSTHTSHPSSHGPLPVGSRVPGSENLTRVLRRQPSGPGETLGSAHAFSFPVSASYIRVPNNTRPRQKAVRRKDGIDISSNSQWIGEGFVDGQMRSRSRAFYPGFRFLDEPGVEYRLLDHVLLFKLSPDGEEEDDSEEDTLEPPTPVASSQHAKHAASVSTAMNIDGSPPAAAAASGSNTPAAPLQGHSGLFSQPNASATNGVVGTPSLGARVSDSTTSKPGLLQQKQNASNPPLTPSLNSKPETIVETSASDVAPTSATDEAKASQGTPDFYVGQIEALWEEADGTRKARIAWFFWPIETQLDEKKFPYLKAEVYTSCEVDVVALSSIAGKVKVVPYSEYVKLPPQESSNAPIVVTSPASAQLRERVSNRQLEGSTYRTDYNGEGEELELGTRLRAEHQVKLSMTQRLLFARYHYHQRAGKIVGVADGNQTDGSGLNPWMHSFIHATTESPDSSKLVSTEASFKDKVCPYTLGVADTVYESPVNECMKIGGIEEVLKKAPTCAFCFERLPASGHIECAVCTGIVLCFECFSLGRQGKVQTKICTSKIGTATGAAESKQSTEKSDGTTAQVQYLHRSNHAYRVVKPYLDYSNPKLALELLEWMCNNYGLNPPTFEIIGIVRGPLPSREERGPSTRYRYAATFTYAPLRIKFKHPRAGTVAHVIGSRYGKSVEEAKGILAIDSLCAVFGVSNKLNIPMLSGEWKARESLRLVDALGIHGLAWEPAEEIVGYKSAQECAEFFACYLHPAWASQSEWAEELRKVVDSKTATANERERYLGNKPPPTEPAVTRATVDALEWGRKVHEMAVRRSKASRRVHRGLAFALVDGQTVFARRPDAFGGRVTPNTEKILTMNVDPSSVPQTERYLFSGSDVLAYPGMIKNEVCGVCGRTDRPECLILCDGCDAQQHWYCVDKKLTGPPEGDWFCADCMSDRDYLYDHCSWGDAGATLVRLVKDTGVWTMPGEKGPVVQKRVLEWQDNDRIIKDASTRAIQMGFGAIASRAKRPKSSPDSAVETGYDQDERERAKKARGNQSKYSRDSNGYGTGSAINPRDAPEDLSLSREEVANQVAWATRHHASQAVATLEAANRGLAEALAQVVAQRDALLAVVEAEPKTSVSNVPGQE